MHTQRFPLFFFFFSFQFGSADIYACVEILWHLQNGRRFTVYCLEQLEVKAKGIQEAALLQKPKALVMENLVSDHAGLYKRRRELKNGNEAQQALATQKNIKPWIHESYNVASDRWCGTPAIDTLFLLPLM